MDLEYIAGRWLTRSTHTHHMETPHSLLAAKDMRWRNRCWCRFEGMAEAEQRTAVAEAGLSPDIARDNSQWGLSR